MVSPTLGCLATDCGRAPPPPPRVPRSYAGVDLQARDYDSLLRLLFDKLLALAPDWKDRSEADLGIVLLELFAYAGDQLAWLQERVALEGRLRTATQWESVRKLLRLIDHALHPGLAAQAWLTFEVTGNAPLVLPAGFAVYTSSAASTEPVVYETGEVTVLAPALSRIALAADAPSSADRLQLLLAADLSGLLVPGSPLLIQQGRQSEWMRVAAASFGATTTLTLTQPLAGSYTAVGATAALAQGNVVAASHGATQHLRVPGNGAPRQRVELELAPLAYLDDATGAPRSTLEVRLAGVRWVEVEDFIDSQAADFHYRVARDNAGHVAVLFGDGERGAVPAAGDAVQIRWRVGGGRAGNVGPDALTQFDRTLRFAHASQRIVAVRNPQASFGARDPDSLADAKLLGPATLRRMQRAVVPADFEAALDEGVQHAGTRWVPLQSRARVRSLGHGRVVVVSVDLPDHRPLASVPGLAAAFVARLRERKLAGLDVQVEDARFCALHIALKIEVGAEHFAREVRAAVEGALLGPGPAAAMAAAPLPFFAAGRFRFGQAVHLSDLYAAVAAIEGVAAIAVTRFKRLGDRYPDREAAGLIEVGALEVARCDNRGDSADGVLFMRMLGGKPG